MVGIFLIPHDLAETRLWALAKHRFFGRHLFYFQLSIRHPRNSFEQISEWTIDIRWQWLAGSRRKLLGGQPVRLKGWSSSLAAAAWSGGYKIFGLVFFHPHFFSGKKNVYSVMHLAGIADKIFGCQTGIQTITLYRKWFYWNNLRKTVLIVLLKWHFTHLFEDQAMEIESYASGVF